MTTVKSCVTCQRATTACDVVDVEKLETGYYCPLWESACDTDIAARTQIVRDFGPWALGCGIPRLQKSAGRRFRRHRKYGS